VASRGTAFRGVWEHPLGVNGPVLSEEPVDIDVDREESDGVVGDWALNVLLEELNSAGFAVGKGGEVELAK